MNTEEIMTVWEVNDEWQSLSTWLSKEDAIIALQDLRDRYPDSQFYVGAVSVQQIKGG